MAHATCYYQNNYRVATRYAKIMQVFSWEKIMEKVELFSWWGGITGKVFLNHGKSMERFLKSCFAHTNRKTMRNFMQIFNNKKRKLNTNLFSRKIIFIKYGKNSWSMEKARKSMELFPPGSGHPINQIAILKMEVYILYFVWFRCIFYALTVIPFI